MCREIDPTTPQCILELGAGMGPVTEVIRSNMHPESQLIAVEVDPELHAIASRRCPDVDVVLGSAGDIDDILDARDLGSVDCFVSCLPVPSLPKDVNRSILDAWKRRCRSAFFTQITQIPWYFMPMYQRAFHDVEFQLITMNLPPAGVYHCSNLRPDYDSRERLPGK
jgi:phospholipid N-methyltransferase